MFKERIKRIRNIACEANQADAFLLVNHEMSGQPGTEYISGFSGSESILLITKNENLLLTDGRYLSQAKEECEDFKIISTERSSLESLEELNLKKVAVDATRAYYNSILKLENKIKGISWIDMGNILQEVRIIKDEAELKKMREAASIANTAFNKLLPNIKEGMTEKELAWELERLMREGGAEKNAFDLIVVSGSNGAKPHGKPSDKKIVRGELITFDFGCFFEGYASDTTRTIAMGAVDSKLTEIYEIVRVAQELGCKAAKAGVSGQELDKICRDYIVSKGYGDYFLHSTGHGLGMEVHELPNVAKSNTKPLLENCVVTIEPGIYIEGLGGVRIEDTVIITKTGNINLNDEISKELIVI